LSPWKTAAKDGRDFNWELEIADPLAKLGVGFGRAEDRFWRKSGEESPNTKERDAA
jgi:hypothetical protein